jgi:hypothetical protein
MFPFSLLRFYTYRGMETVGTPDKAASAGWTDQEIVDRVKAGDTALYDFLTV